MPNVTISYDLISTAYIYQQRKKCHHLQNYLMNHENYITYDEDDVNIKTIVNKIIMALYIKSNKIMIDEDNRLIIVTSVFQRMVENIYFIDFEYYSGDINVLYDYIDRLNLNEKYIIKYING